jgi:hypothetical protein
VLSSGTVNLLPNTGALRLLRHAANHQLDRFQERPAAEWLWEVRAASLRLSFGAHRRLVMRGDEDDRADEKYRLDRGIRRRVETCVVADRVPVAPSAVMP